MEIVIKRLSPITKINKGILMTSIGIILFFIFLIEMASVEFPIILSYISQPLSELTSLFLTLTLIN